MFSKRRSTDSAQRDGRSVPSLISADVHIVGTLSSDGEMQVDGKVDGNVRSSRVVIGGTGVVNGEIVAEDVVIRGEVNGPIRGRKVHLGEGAKVTGDILHGTLAVETGAIFEGSIRRSENPLEELKKLPSPKPAAPAEKPARKTTRSKSSKARSSSSSASSSSTKTAASDTAAAAGDTAAKVEDGAQPASPSASSGDESASKGPVTNYQAAE